MKDFFFNLIAFRFLFFLPWLELRDSLIVFLSPVIKVVKKESEAVLELGKVLPLIPSARAGGSGAISPFLLSPAVSK